MKSGFAVLVLAFSVGVILYYTGYKPTLQALNEERLAHAETQNKLADASTKYLVCRINWDTLVATVITFPKQRGEIIYIVPASDETLFPPLAYNGPFPAIAVGDMFFPIDCTE